MPYHVTEADFEKLIGESLDELPEQYINGLDNVLITFEPEPTSEQRIKLKLRCTETLYGLYEGIPRTERGVNYALVLPDKITIFQHPIEIASNSHKELKEHIRHTLWHEIAHHYGLNHAEIHKRDL
jgi:predicted Zn-dependent protease with MMP-like domain